MIRPMASNASALSNIVANGHQAIHFVCSALSIHSFIPYGGFSLNTAGSQPCPPAPFRNLSGLRLTQELPFTRFYPFLIQASGCSSFTWLPRRSISTKPNRCNAASTCRPVSRGSFTPTPRPRAARRPRLGRGLVPDTTRWPRAGSGAPRRGSCPDSNNCATTDNAPRNSRLHRARQQP